MLMPSVMGRDFFEDLFDDSWFGGRNLAKVADNKKIFGTGFKHMMQTDIKEMDDKYSLIMNLPGYDKSEITAAVDDGYLTIEASKSVDTEKTSDDNEKYIYQERYVGNCKRSFFVGHNLSKEDIKASFEGGILTVDIPKKDALTKEEKMIAIN